MRVLLQQFNGPVWNFYLPDDGRDCLYPFINLATGPFTWIQVVHPNGALLDTITKLQCYQAELESLLLRALYQETRVTIAYHVRPLEGLVQIQAQSPEYFACLEYLRLCLSS